MLSCSSCDLCTSIEDSDDDDDDDIFEGSDDETFHFTKQSKEEAEDKEFLQRYPDEATIEMMCEDFKLPKQSLTSFDKFSLLDHDASIYNKATRKNKGVYKVDEWKPKHIASAERLDLKTNLHYKG